jgi:hypothetical protein
MPVTLHAAFADQGWHIRWRTSDTEAFEATREAFKHTLSFTERYWDPEAFGGKGGWWVAYGALSQVGHLFDNYQELRDQLESEHWKRYEQQLKEQRQRFAREQGQQQWQGQRAQRQGAEQPRNPLKGDDLKFPRTVEEAFGLLSLTPPVTLHDIKHAYRRQALKYHPDRGGSHAAMVKINAAYELALEAS